MQPRYVRIDDRRMVEAGQGAGGCAACGWFGALGGPYHSTSECLACGTVQCEGLRSTCSVCLVGLFKRMTVVPCGYARCTNPAVAEAPRVKRVCHGHMYRAKYGRGLTVAQLVVSNLDDRSRTWVLFP